jgi:hypothetical protein
MPFCLYELVNGSFGRYCPKNCKHKGEPLCYKDIFSRKPDGAANFLESPEEIKGKNNAAE